MGCSVSEPVYDPYAAGNSRNNQPFENPNRNQIPSSTQQQQQNIPANNQQQQQQNKQQPAVVVVNPPIVVC
jgi:hypothetical protein